MINILNNTSNFLQKFPNSSPSPEIGELSFFLYNENVFKDLDANNKINTENDVVVGFQGMRDFAIKRVVSAPTEPLEDGQFSNDSILSMPYTIDIVAIASPPYIAGKVYDEATRRNYINEVINLINKNMNSQNTVNIIKTKPIFETFRNVKIIGFDYLVNQDVQNLVAFLKLQETRIAPSQYGSSNTNTVRNPQDSTTNQNGNVSPQPISPDMEKNII